MYKQYARVAYSLRVEWSADYCLRPKGVSKIWLPDIPKYLAKKKAIERQRRKFLWVRGGGVGVRCTRENWPEALSNVVSCIVRVL